MPQLQARLSLRRRRSPWAAVGPLLRWLTFWGLIVALTFGGYKYLLLPTGVEALEFTPHSIVATGKAIGVLGVAAADIDGDGFKDIITAGTNGVKIYKNDGKQKFTATTVDTLSAERVQTIDLDEDGTLDLLVTLKNSPGVKWYRNNGDMTFAGNEIGTSRGVAAWAGDIDGDGDNDIVAATDEGGSIVLRRWMNDGGGSFSSVTLSAKSKVSAITIGDLNGGYSEIITGGGAGLQKWQTNDGFTWSRVDIDDQNENQSYLVVTDINDDGQTDIVTADADKNIVAVYRSIDQQGYDRLVMPQSADATTVVAADLDGDGDQDILAAGQDDNTIYWYENDGSETFTQHTVAAGLQSVFGLAVADMDRDKDLDVVTADHFQGIIYWYERIRSKPVATGPTNIEQATDATGRINFDTTISDGDSDPTRLKVQYSLDGLTWYKPALTSVSADAGSADLKSSNEYQIGTSNAIDTNTNAAVTITMAWDTRSTLNANGPLIGEFSKVRLRVTARDAKSIGATVQSAQFRVDNQAPQGLANFKINAVSPTEVEVGWQSPSDSNTTAYIVYYGTDESSVQDETASGWDSVKDGALDDIETSNTTITGLTANLTYYFKLVARDEFGNISTAPLISGVPTTPTAGSPTPQPPGASATPNPSASPTPVPSGSVLPSPGVSPTPTPTESETPPPTTAQNHAPVADAGPNQVVNPSALVILDGTASIDSDQDTLTYSWRQVSGPKVNLVSERTATPSFSAGAENESYIFALTVRDSKGASAADSVTVAVRALPQQQAIAVRISASPPPVAPSTPTPLLVSSLLAPADYVLLVLSVLSVGMSMGERLVQSWRQRTSQGASAFGPQQKEAPRGRIVHYRTGEPIVGAQVLIYGLDGKLRASERTGSNGGFSTLFPAGTYTIGVEANGFVLGASLSGAMKPTDGLVYTGGSLVVRDGNKPLTIVIPLKPTTKEITSLASRLLRLWQTIQHAGRILSWPVFVLGALLNTTLVFWVPAPQYLVIEIAYVALVILKMVLEVRLRPAYGLVRDAITHVPLDLAVVRLFEQGTNRLVMTRVTNGQGKFFALPPAASYTITVTKPGYAVFARDNVEISADHDSALQITAELMPMAPMGRLAIARAAVM